MGLTAEEKEERLALLASRRAENARSSAAQPPNSKALQHPSPHHHVRRPEHLPGWYRTTEEGLRPGDPDEAKDLYPFPAQGIYRKDVLEFPGDAVRQRDQDPHSSISQPQAYRSRDISTSRERRRWWFTFATLMAAVGLGFGVLENELLWTYGSSERLSTELLKVCVLILTLMSLFGMYSWAYWEVRLLKDMGNSIPNNETFHTKLEMAGLRSQFYAYSALLLIIPFPGVSFEVDVLENLELEYTRYSSDSLAVLLMMLLRVPLLFKCWAINDPLQSSRNQVYMKSTSVFQGTRFIISTRLKNEIMPIIYLWLLCIGSMAYCIMIAERPRGENMDLAEYHNSVWLTIITMTSVGYGDQYPTSFLGRLFAVASCFIATILLALSVNVVSSRLSLEEGEKKVVRFHRVVKERSTVRQVAARCIQRLYLLSPVYRNLHPNSKFQKRELAIAWNKIDITGLGPLCDAKLVSCLREFRRIRLYQGGQESEFHQDVQFMLSQSLNTKTPKHWPLSIRPHTLYPRPYTLSPRRYFLGP